MNTYPLSLPAIRVVQPLGEFFVFAVKADILRTITFLDPTRISTVDKQSFFYSLLGSQREHSIPRAKKIAKYINTVEAAFPNSIILAGNYINYGELQEDENARWKIKPGADGTFRLEIPTDKKMASVIDGQHRMLGFDYCDAERREMELLCAVYMDLPQTYQAYLFATININQRKVDKSLAYEQFGYNLDDESRDSWAPDKCAVFLTRKLNLDPKSPFHQHVKIAPLDEDLVFPSSDSSAWKVSTASVVEGLVRLISSDPKGDRDTLHRLPVARRSRKLLRSDTAPLRKAFLQCEDVLIYDYLTSYFALCEEIFWKTRKDASYIAKTVGIQALFDVLRLISSDLSLEAMTERARKVLEASSGVDFADPIYQASGKGRVRIKNTFLFLAEIITENDLPEADKDLYLQVRQKFGRPSQVGAAAARQV